MTHLKTFSDAVGPAGAGARRLLASVRGVAACERASIGGRAGEAGTGGGTGSGGVEKSCMATRLDERNKDRVNASAGKLAIPFHYTRSNALLRIVRGTLSRCASPRVFTSYASTGRISDMSDAQLPQFPPAWKAGADGLLAVGGQLSSDWLLAAYRQGIFPWPIIEGDTEILAWYTPDPRAILELDRFHVSRRLHRRLRSDEFQVSFNTNFAAVVAGCAEPRDSEPFTWITPDLTAAYQRLHELGHAHSVEVWQQGQLVGGVYGVAMGGFFSGESMFHRRRDASKVGLACLVQRLRQRRFTLFDVQQSSRHLSSLGATEIPRREFLLRLEKSVDLPVSFPDTSPRTC